MLQLYLLKYIFVVANQQKLEVGAPIDNLWSVPVRLGCLNFEFLDLLEKGKVLILGKIGVESVKTEALDSTKYIFKTLQLGVHPEIDLLCDSILQDFFVKCLF